MRAGRRRSSVMLIVPLGVLGALLAVSLRVLPNDVYFKVGLITIIGLAAKNAILIVEFAIDEQAQGKTLHDAVVEAARLRLRPILMTSFAFILGVMPLVSRPAPAPMPSRDRHGRGGRDVVRSAARRAARAGVLRRGPPVDGGQARETAAQLLVVERDAPTQALYRLTGALAFQTPFLRRSRRSCGMAHLGLAPARGE